MKHLPDTSLSVLLKTFNDIWETGNVPKSWKEATIIPMPKPGKDNTNPNNYRPIALTSCICKTLERMINERLVWYLEKNNIITEFQSGFRQKRGWSGGAMVLGKLPVPGRPTIWMIVGQGPVALAVGAGGGCLDIFTLLYPFSPLSPSLWETARYRLQYCLKEPLSPKTTNQPNQAETQY